MKLTGEQNAHQHGVQKTRNDRRDFEEAVFYTGDKICTVKSQARRIPPIARKTPPIHQLHNRALIVPITARIAESVNPKARSDGARSVSRLYGTVKIPHPRPPSVDTAGAIKPGRGLLWRGLGVDGRWYGGIAFAAETGEGSSAGE